MTISIGTSTPSTARDTHAAWLRRREDSHPHFGTLVSEAGRREEQDARADRQG